MFIAVTAIWPLRHIGLDDHAVRQLEKIVEMFPNVADLVDYLHEICGEIYLQKGKYDDAVAARGGLACVSRRAVFAQILPSYTGSTAAASPFASPSRVDRPQSTPPCGSGAGVPATGRAGG
jgi:hypothetical protein